jgi:hypothetical protein
LLAASILKPIALTSAECLNLINLKPITDVEVHLVRFVTSHVLYTFYQSFVPPTPHQLVEDCEERLAEDEVTDLLRIVAELL